MLQCLPFTEDCSQLSASSKFVPAPESVISPDSRPAMSRMTASPASSNTGGSFSYHSPRGQSPRSTHVQHQNRNPQQPHQQTNSYSNNYSQSNNSNHQRSHQGLSAHQASHQGLSAHQASHHAVDNNQFAGGSSRGGRVSSQQRGRTATRHAITPAASSPKVKHNSHHALM